MRRIDYYRLRSNARYAKRQMHAAHASDSRFYTRRLADGRLAMDAIAETAAEAAQRVPGGLGRYGNDPLRLSVRDRLRRARDERRRIDFMNARASA